MKNILLCALLYLVSVSVSAFVPELKTIVLDDVVKIIA